MRTKLTMTDPEAALDRILDAVARELVGVSDDEILAAAKDLGMDPMMKGSAAFIGLRIPALAHYTDFFESEHFRDALTTLAQMNLSMKAAEPPAPKARSRRPKRPSAVERKH
jgi:hypothetical protein